MTPSETRQRDDSIGNEGPICQSVGAITNQPRATPWVWVGCLYISPERAKQLAYPCAALSGYLAAPAAVRLKGTLGFPSPVGHHDL